MKQCAMLVAQTAKAGREMTESLENLGVVNVPELEVLSAEKEFATLLRESISQGMNRVLGAGGTQAILYHLDLPSFDNPKRFHEKLTAIFGVGTASLERVILQQLHQTMGVRPASSKEDDFVDQVELARRKFETSARLNRRH
jgi:ribonucleotide monophosphatase NagD (HAD superfamily)